MKRRTQEQWLSLFSEHKAGGLKAIEFCKEHGICPNYFSKRKSQLLIEHKPTKESTFVPVMLNTAESSLGLELQYEKTVIKIPINIQANWLAQFIHALES